MGAPPEAIAQAEKRVQAERNTIEVLECNRETVDLYQACQLGYLGVGMRAVCLGLDAREIHAALSWSDLPRERWKAVGDGMRMMGLTAASAINARAAAAR